ncbi:Serine_carboxypeptidase [Hexamita inflata]|uniref:Serine carboxypeptidase n=1 Tax=Hexamita inflata TaxID=28002 RepID=A0AA86QKF3_9EUKA|nr:Serine carboxypeptidase [Hexamita inflata]CAI9959644.1 Serine carboxypeptidase [Hexamita inflata]
MLFAVSLNFAQIQKWFERDPSPLQSVGDDFYKTFDQLVDHFDNTNTKTFKQRFLVNSSVYKNGPLIIMLNGEGTLGAATLAGKYSINYFAEEMNGFMVALEHRYYGESKIDPEMKDMQYLSSKQEIADISKFIPYIKEQYKLKDNKVIVIGGSYTGNIAAWARIQLPFAIDAAIATSGPAMGILDFDRYMKHAQEQFVKITSTQCYHNTTVALTALNKLLVEDPKQFKTLFGLTTEMPDEPTAEDIQVISSYLSTEIIGSIQYYDAPNYDNNGYEGTLQIMCNKFLAPLTRKSTEAEIISSYIANVQPLNIYGELTYKAFIDQLKNPTADSFNTRAWLWQTCTEFGYYQTTDSKQMWGDKQTIESNIKMCYDAFFAEQYQDPDLALTTAYLNDMIDFTNAWYGARNAPRTHIYYTNGRVDPWSELAVVQGLKWTDGQYVGDCVTEWIDNGSHCTDMYLRWKINDPVRERQLNKLKEWLM